MTEKKPSNEMKERIDVPFQVGDRVKIVKNRRDPFQSPTDSIDSAGTTGIVESVNKGPMFWIGVRTNDGNLVPVHNIDHLEIVNGE